VAASGAMVAPVKKKRTMKNNWLELHRLWLDGVAGGERAELAGADLTNARLTNCVLAGADLTDCVLPNAQLNHAVLTGAVLTGAVLPHGVPVVEKSK